MQILDRPFAELTTRQFHDLVRLRVDVFVVEQECAYGELDGRDLEDGTRHVWIERDREVVSYLRVLDDGGARRIGLGKSGGGGLGAGVERGHIRIDPSRDRALGLIERHLNLRIHDRAGERCLG